MCSVSADAAEYPVANQACRAFIEATVQYHDEVSDRKNLKRLVCYPKTATIADGKAAFLAWTKAKAGDKKLMAEQPVVGLVRSLAAKYPLQGLNPAPPYLVRLQAGRHLAPARQPQE